MSGSNSSILEGSKLMSDKIESGEQQKTSTSTTKLNSIEFSTLKLYKIKGESDVRREEKKSVCVRDGEKYKVQREQCK